VTVDTAQVTSLESEDDLNPALEIRIDDSKSPVAVQRMGLLNRGTGAPLLSAIDDLLADGRRLFTVDAGQEVIAGDLGGTSLAFCQRWVHDAGGRLFLTVGIWETSQVTAGGR